MNLKKCYSCEVELSKNNKSVEHILGNSVGDKLKSSFLLCEKCNSKLGQETDKALADQTIFIAIQLGIDRDRTNRDYVKAIGNIDKKQYFLQKDGGVKMGNIPIIDKNNGNIVCRDMKQAKQTLEGLKRSQPNIDIEKSLDNAKIERKYMNQKLRHDVGLDGKDVFRVICKNAINFYMHKGGERSQISHLLPYIWGQEEENIVWYNYDNDIYQLTDDECFHSINLIADEKQKILYAHVEYFNIYKYIVILNDNYLGSDLNETYCFDVINRKNISKTINLNYDREDVLNLLSNKDLNYSNKFKKEFSRVIQIARKLQFEKATEKIFLDVGEKMLSLYPNNENTTPEMMDFYSREIAENMAMLLANYSSNK